MRRMLMAAVAAVVLFAIPANGQQVKLKFGSLEPSTANITANVWTPWAADVTRDSGGALQVEMYPIGTLNRNPLLQLKLLQDGVLDVAFIVPAFTPGRFDDNEVVELPFLVRGTLEGSLALWRLYAKGMLRGYDDLKVLGLFTTPPTNVQAAFPVKTPADLKGKKFRSAGGFQAKLLEQLGAVGVVIPGTQVAENLSRRLIDGALVEWNFVASWRVMDVTTHHVIVPMGTNTLMVAMAKDGYDRLPPAARAAIDKHSGEAFARRFGTNLDKFNAEMIERARKEPNHTVIGPTAEEDARWRQAVIPAIEAWRKANPRNEALLKAYEEELAAVRAGR